MTTIFYSKNKQQDTVQLHKQQPMFQLSLKIEGQIVNLPVYKTDSKKSLITKLLLNRNCKLKDEGKLYALMKDRLFDSLLNIAKSDKLNESLKQKVNRFIHQEFKKDIKQIELQRSKHDQQNQKVVFAANTKSKGYPSSSKKISNSIQKRIFNSKMVNQTPYSKLLSKKRNSQNIGENALHQQSFPRAVSPQNRHRKANCSSKQKSIQKSQSPSSLLKKPPSDSKAIEQQKMLQKAYQIILRSAKDQGMKKMALKCLQNMTQRSNKKHVKFSYNDKTQKTDRQICKNQIIQQQNATKLNYIYTSQFGKEGNYDSKKIVEVHKLRNKSLGHGVQRKYNYQQFFVQEIGINDSENRQYQQLKLFQRDKQMGGLQKLRQDFDSLQRHRKVRNRTARSYERMPEYLQQVQAQRKLANPDVKCQKIRRQPYIQNNKNTTDLLSLSLSSPQVNQRFLGQSYNLLMIPRVNHKNSHQLDYDYKRQAKHNKSSDAIYRGRRYKYEI